MQVGGGGGLNSDINVTPLVDVVLVLLIIFMVLTPLTPRGYDVQIPRETQTFAPPPDTETKQVILAISEQDCPVTQPLGPAGLPPDCTVRLNKEPTRVSALKQRIEDIFKNRRQSDRLIFVAAQEKLNYEAVVQIIDIAKSGVEGMKLGIVTDEKLATDTSAE
jgi:biopolymer transport protein ExbD